VALWDVSFKVREGEIFVIIGSPAPQVHDHPLF
jgi:ABC-type multidrug transport system ATPase subunit